MSQPTIVQQLMVMGMNYGTVLGITKAIDYFSALDEDDLREISHQMSPEYAAKFYAMAKAAKNGAVINEVK